MKAVRMNPQLIAGYGMDTITMAGSLEAKLAAIEAARIAWGLS